MSFVSNARAFLHQVSWGTLLGAQIFESFVVVKLAYRHLPYRQFVELQQHLFPAYFRLQMALAFLTMATLPAEALLSTAPKALWLRNVPLLLTTSCTVLNWATYGPKTAALMLKKANMQQPSDSDAHSHNKVPKGGVAAADSPTQKPVAKRFKTAHAMSIHLNAIALVCTLWAGMSFVAL